jgi:hypothetical protein
LRVAFGGKPEELPFDLRHRRGAITYRLDSVSHPFRDKVRKDLVKQLVAALKTNLAAPREDQLIRNPMPLLSVERSDDMPNVLDIPQAVQLEGVTSLAEIMAKTPVKTQADQRAPASPFEDISLGSLDIFRRGRVKPFREWTKEELEGYNQQVRWYYERCKKYLEEVKEHNFLLQRTLAMRLVLVNRGARPATDAWAEITFSEGILVYENDDLPKLPPAPRPPAFAPNGSSSAIIQTGQPYAEFLNKPPRITDDRTSLTFRTGKIQQGHQVSIKTFTVVMDNKEDIHSFEAVYHVGADELPRKTTGELYFEVKQAED